MGSSLKEQFRYCGSTFTIQTIIYVAIKMLENIEAFHETGFVHKNLNPNTFLTGATSKDEKIIYLTDFSQAGRY